MEITPILVALLGGGFVAGLVALLRFRVDKDAVIVTAAQGAVIVQSGVIDALQEELQRARADRNEAQQKTAALEQEIERLKTELKKAKDGNT